MHQPYYKNLLTGEVSVPWVRLHGIKDYLDTLLILRGFPKIHLTFNLVPCLIEQIEDYTYNKVQDKHLQLSYKPAEELTTEDKQFIINNFFGLYAEYGIAPHPRYYQLYLKKQSQQEFTTQELRDLQVWFNLAWFDPYFRKNIKELKYLVDKGRFFTEEEKHTCLDKQFEVLSNIIPSYKEFQSRGQIEVITSPYYHPILPLLYNSKIAREANPEVQLPEIAFNFPQDAQSQIQIAVEFYQQRFGSKPRGMWPSEEAVSEHILGLFIQSGINWIVTDEAMLFKSLRKRKRVASYLYKPYRLMREEGEVNIVFRDRNLSDLISFVYHRLSPLEAVGDFLDHLENIHQHCKLENPLVVVALDGENAWEYYRNDGWNFLTLLYQQLCTCEFLRTVTVSEYLQMFPPEDNLDYLKPGSWVGGDFNKWIGSSLKNRAWQYLAQARAELQQMIDSGQQVPEPALKQIHIAEGSDWFWWYGDTDDKTFDELFRMHLSNLYHLLGKAIPEQFNKIMT